jgi:hypothetical protein
MAKSLNIALNFALIAIVVKFALFILELSLEYGVYGYFLFILFALFFGLRKHFDINKYQGFGNTFKEGMRISSVYSLVITVFTYIYYKFIDTGFLPGKLRERVIAAKEAGYSEEQIEQIREGGEFIFSLAIHTSFTLFGFMILGLVYSVIWAFLFWKLPQSRGSNA